MDKLLALKMFVETVDAKGFSAAGRRLNLATSSVTRALDGLEASLGAVLLNRSTRLITVTEAGAAYYQRARRILDAVEEADALIADRGEEPVGQLRVSLPVAFGRRCIAPYLGDWLAKYPQLEVEVTLTDDIVDLLGERIDLSVRLGSPASYDNVVAREIGRFRRHVVASPDYLQGHGSPADPVDLVNHRCLRFSYGARDQVWTFRQDDSETKVPVSGHFRSNNAEVLRDVALAGAGIGLLPDWLVDHDIASGQLTALFDDWSVNPDQASSAISALYLPTQRGSRRIGAFLEFLAALPGPTRRRD
ncbi:LysR substrate-binding domain-containing protein [Cupriavidus sp. WKF15]|uniref:LysR family transcriptional regulator n=1 Tax=Cupriavidus sp. WKF15 TaxID=3032282 RepID=UPI0023E150C9|nr:LysR family transcriptional regulator [Cupriavidus sp. WKF15]WER47683.1 LysR substrate-binding domain-containing protein [Cupriavidus sp. WKF15]